MMTHHNLAVPVYNNDQKRITAPGADQNLIETLIGISIYVPHVIDAGYTQSAEVETVDLRPDVQYWFGFRRHIAHWSREARIELFG